MRLGIGQLGLLVAMIAFAVYATRVRSSLSDRVVYLVLAATGIPLVLFPDFSTRIAHLVGIGRGADLVVYLFIVFSLFYFASNASQSRMMKRQLTLLVRALAIQGAVDGPPAPPDERTRANGPGAEDAEADDDVAPHGR